MWTVACNKIRIHIKQLALQQQQSVRNNHVNNNSTGSSHISVDLKTFNEFRVGVTLVGIIGLKQKQLSNKNSSIVR